MTEPRHTDQDVAQLYVAMRDGVLALPTLSWWQRLLDWWAPARAAARRLEAIEAAYREWQREHRPPREKIAPLTADSSRALALGMHMIRSQRSGRDYAEHKSVEVREG